MAGQSETASSKITVEQILMDWDCADVMEGVQRLAQHYPSSSLKQWLELTSIAEGYRLHHKV
ncbi:MAG: hypothetical protein V7677_13605, partial [Motiliproteus sp.]